ncbi:hypothetical protein BC833DRAFT_648126 [Globomyces pollinis-pini]|nr:hypothetical protein BC833DRAFT_648126 [Globomyces pollinis-pini]
MKIHLFRLQMRISSIDIIFTTTNGISVIVIIISLFLDICYKSLQSWKHQQNLLGLLIRVGLLLYHIGLIFFNTATILLEDSNFQYKYYKIPMAVTQYIYQISLAAVFISFFQFGINYLLSMANLLPRSRLNQLLVIHQGNLPYYSMTFFVIIWLEITVLYVTFIDAPQLSLLFRIVGILVYEVVILLFMLPIGVDLTIAWVTYQYHRKSQSTAYRIFNFQTKTFDTVSFSFVKILGIFTVGIIYLLINIIPQLLDCIFILKMNLNLAKESYIYSTKPGHYASSLTIINGLSGAAAVTALFLSNYFVKSSTNNLKLSSHAIRN